MAASLIGGFPKIRGTCLGGPHNKDSSVLGSILGSPYLGKLPISMTPSARHIRAVVGPGKG